MKKVLYLLLALIVLIIIMNVQVNLSSNDFLSISLQNIEALSFTESSDYNCLGLGSLDCPKQLIKAKYIY